ncbi:DUF58 domain-containing protein [Flavobacteriaceae bacterium YJPT1-3]|nr:DUF58 domain-containing protein [Flavobacteriaceae bacterium YJPT1-3]
MRLIRSLYVQERVYWLLAILAVLYLFSFWYPLLFTAASVLGVLAIFMALVDLVFIYRPDQPLKASRRLPDKFSNSDLNTVELIFNSTYGKSISLELIDEIPVQFQKRDFMETLHLTAGETKRFSYALRPLERGAYVFGHLNVYAYRSNGLFKRRFKFMNDQMVKVYPSFIQMKKYAFLALDQKLTLPGMKRIRRIGHTMEFEQIKEYIPGDDVRTINWKATAKSAKLMVNQFQDERSQPIYSIIDAGRVMKMPFQGLTLLDYAINSTLAFSNVALKKNDKVGLVTFANTLINHLPASKKKSHLSTLLEVLYNINTGFLDSDFSGLFAHLKRKVPNRSLLMLYTNFEHMSALERQLPFFQRLAKKHLLVVIFFQNTELDALLKEPAKDLVSVYQHTIAAKFEYEKRLMVKALEKHGIQTILTKPEDLSVKTINKYLEIKARGLL